MALFTNKADRHISILTRLYEVEPHEYEALIPQLWEAHSLHRPWDGEEKEAELIAGLKADADRLTFFLDLLREAMDAIADGHTMSYEGEARLNDALEKYTEPPQIDWVYGAKRRGGNYPSEPPPSGRAWAYPQVGYGDDGLQKTGKPLFEQIRTRVCGVLLYAVERAEFKRCAESTCKNPFASVSRKQIFCSTRCRHRNGQRERMKKLFAK